MLIVADVSAQGKALVRALLTADASRRPTAAQVLQHPWLTGPGEARQSTLGGAKARLSALSHGEKHSPALASLKKAADGGGGGAKRLGLGALNTGIRVESGTRRTHRLSQMATQLRKSGRLTGGSRLTGGRLTAAEGPASETLPGGAECWYTDREGGRHRVKVLKVHYDDDPPYYTIKMEDGHERETVPTTHPHPPPTKQNH